MDAKQSNGNAKALPLSIINIRRVARAAKELLGVGKGLYVDIMDILEHKMQNIAPDFHFEIVGDSEMKEEAITYPDESRMVIRESVYLNAIRDLGRDRMTIAHEFGHFFLHDSERVSYVLSRSKGSIKAYEDPEWQASCFGGEFLMDHDLIRGLSEDEIVEKCVVSHDAAHIQRGRK